MALLGCSPDAIPPYGEARIVVDTDVPVGSLVNRLRIDIYGADGAWRASRDVPLANPRDWPTSFGVFASRDDAPTRALVRLRAYSDRRVRDYRGERYAPRVDYAPPAVASDVDDLCTHAPELRMHEPLVVRRGFDTLTSLDGTVDCELSPDSAGNTAAYVDIPTAGDYRFEVLGTVPAEHLSTTLELRQSCDDTTSAVACTLQPYLDVSLQPGRYHLLTSTRFQFDDGVGLAPTDIMVAVAPSTDWDDPELAPRPPPAAELPAEPLWLGDDPARTPSVEPLPSMTIDRLIAVELVPGEVGSVRVVLRGECMGTMADLGTSRDDQTPDLDRAQTCVDRENERVAVSTVALVPDRIEEGFSEQGRFGFSEPCDEGPDGEVICVPGGLLVLGGHWGSAPTELGSTPERLARVGRFFVDRDEVTVQRWRAARVAGFDPRPWEPWTSEVREHCRWAPSPGPYEDHPVNCVTWYGARAFCQFVGGDLPTEAQWEYVATQAWRDEPTRYPWGNDEPTCDRAVYARFFAEFPSPDCADVGLGPASIAESALDRTPGPGVRGLGGNVNEWVLDAFYGLDSPCWNATGFDDPACLEEHAPRRSQRGGSWASAGDALESERRSWHPPIYRIDYEVDLQRFGFRCVYPERP